MDRIDFWDESELVQLRDFTRASLFDFGKVSALLIQNHLLKYPDSKLSEVNQKYSPEKCRWKFADDYSKNDRVVNETDRKTDEASLENDLTFDEIIARQEQRTKQFSIEQDVIFRRVLASLIPDEVSNNSTFVEIDPQIEVALRNQRLKREQERNLKEKREHEAFERQQLEQQREKLRRRFDPGSVDAEGIDPFAGDETRIQLRDVDQVDEAVVDSLASEFNMQKLLENPMFDMLLDSVERDLQFAAEAKGRAADDDSEGGSELADVLRYLEGVAEESRARNRGAREPLAPPPSTPSAPAPTPVRQEPDAAPALSSSPTTPLAAAVAAGSSNRPSPPLTNLLPPSPSPPIPSIALDPLRQPSQHLPARAALGAPRGHAWRQGGASEASSTDRVASASGDLESVYDSEEGVEGEEEDDEDWRKVRELQKARNERILSTLPPSPSPILGQKDAEAINTVGEAADGLSLEESYSSDEWEEARRSGSADAPNGEEAENADEGMADGDDERGDLCAVVEEPESASDGLVAPLQDADSPPSSQPSPVASLELSRDRGVSEEQKAETETETAEGRDDTLFEAGAGNRLSSLLEPERRELYGQGVFKAPVRKRNTLHESVAAARLRRAETPAGPPPAQAKTTWPSPRSTSLANTSSSATVKASSLAVAKPSSVPVVPAPSAPPPSVDSRNTSYYSKSTVEWRSVCSLTPYPPVLPHTTASGADTGSAVLHFTWKMLQQKAANLDVSDVSAVLLDWIVQIVNNASLQIIGVLLEGVGGCSNDDTSKSQDSPLDPAASTSLRLRVALTTFGPPRASPHQDYRGLREQLLGLRRSPSSLLRDVSARGAMVRLLTEQLKLDMKLLDSTTDNSSLQQALEEMSAPSSAILVGAGGPPSCGPSTWMSLRERVACAVLKPHIFHPNAVSGDRTFHRLFGIFGRVGLQLCGLRTADVAPGSDTTQLHPDIARHIQSHRPPAIQCLVVTFLAAAPEPAADLLRTALGPEDPQLAVRTDPDSVRAQLCRSRDANIAFPTPWSADNVWKDFLFWMGPREPVPPAASSEEYGEGQALYSVILPATRLVTFCLRFEGGADVDDVRGLAVLQKRLFDLVSEACSGGLRFLCMQTVSESELVAEWRRSSHSSFATDDMTSPSLTLCLLIRYEGEACASELLVRRTKFERELHGIIESGGIKAGSGSMRHLQGRWSVRALMSWEVLASYDNVFLSKGNDANDGVLPRAVSEDSLIPEQDLRSHEDVGLPDVAVVVYPISADSSAHISSKDALLVKSAPLKVLSSLDPLSFSCLLGASFEPSTCVEQGQRSISGSLFLCVRGHHLIESMATVSASHLSADMASRSALSKTPTLHSDRRILTGRAALNAVLTRFFLLPASHSERNILQWKLADWDFRRTVPSWVSILSSSPTDSRGPGDKQVSGASHAIPTIYLDVARAMFPPGSFQSMAVLLLSWEAVGARRALSRCLKKLRVGSDCGLLAVRPYLLDVEVAEMILRDHENEFLSTIDVVDDDLAGTNTRHSVLSAVGAPFLAVLISANGLTRRLPGVIGPADVRLALERFPKSVVATLAEQMALSPKRRTPSAPPTGLVLSESAELLQVPDVLCTFSCATAETLAEIVFGREYGLSAASLVTRSPLVEAPSSARQQDRAAVSLGIREDWSSSFKKDFAMGPTSQCLNCTTPSPGNLIALPNATEVICVVVTASLLREKGCFRLFEALDKENLRVVNARSSPLDLATARQLCDLAGHSSLSMKPPLQRLLEAPVLLLGLEGSAHSISRLKSLADDDDSFPTIQGQSKYVEAAAGAGAGVLGREVGSSYITRSIWRLDDGDFGALASSSTRLARSLLLACFKRLYGSPWEISALPDAHSGTTAAALSASVDTMEQPRTDLDALD